MWRNKIGEKGDVGSHQNPNFDGLLWQKCKNLAFMKGTWEHSSFCDAPLYGLKNMVLFMMCRRDEMSLTQWNLIFNCQFFLSLDLTSSSHAQFHMERDRAAHDIAIILNIFWAQSLGARDVIQVQI